MQKTIIFSIVILLAVMAVVSPNIARAAVETTSGTVKAFSRGLLGAKVTVQGTDFFDYTATASDGTWSISSGTSGFPSGYYVDAMKKSYTHVQKSGYSGSQSGIEYNLSTRSTVTVKFKIAADEEFRNTYGGSWKTTAKSKLLKGEPLYTDEHSITFADTAYYNTFDSQDGSVACGTMVDEMVSETGWGGGTYSNSDILVGFSGQGFNSSSVQGCVDDIPSTGSTHPATMIKGSATDMALTVSHEMAHLYGFGHTQSSNCSALISGIMNTDTSNVACSNMVENFTPADDITLQNSKRTWY